jgi:DNA-binding winged helix-turn-helix (wHTH) protein
MTNPAANLYEFGEFRVDRVKRLLLRHEEVAALSPKAFDILLTLIENKDRVVPKSELMDTIWPDSFVEEANLTQNVSILRKVLG